MKNLLLSAMVLGLLVSGCGGYLASRNSNMWANSIDQTNRDCQVFS